MSLAVIVLTLVTFASHTTATGETMSTAGVDYPVMTLTQLTTALVSDLRESNFGLALALPPVWDDAARAISHATGASMEIAGFVTGMASLVIIGTVVIGIALIIRNL